MIEEQGWALVTNNAIEFRGFYRGFEVHAGVAFLLPSVRRTEQMRLFEAALEHVPAFPDMVNRALDVSFGPDRTAVVVAYDLP